MQRIKRIISPRMPPSQDSVRRRKGGKSGDRLRYEQRQRWLGNWDEDISMTKRRHTENPERAIPRAKPKYISPARLKLRAMLQEELQENKNSSTDYRVGYRANEEKRDENYEYYPENKKSLTEYQVGLRANEEKQNDKSNMHERIEKY